MSDKSELEAIRARDAAGTELVDAFGYWQLIGDRRTLLAHVDEQAKRIAALESGMDAVQAKLAEYLQRLLEGRTLPNRWVGEINDIVQSARSALAGSKGE